ncbi:MAG TPA: adenylate/guanylate cyclase domain-containing protein [Gemmatimonadales bacterium]|jgi:adenylate cyclase|nr:adenylate/guanylate cyclase domain-containing protein [Gemmatimonadales bacterium]
MTAFRLVSLSGEHTFDVPSGRTLVLGRATGTDFPVNDPTISRRHVELEGTPAGLRVKDLGSSNGTFVGGQKVDERVVAPGETVTFGKVAFSVQAAAATPEPRGPSLSPVPGGTIVRAVGSLSGGGPALPTGDSPSKVGLLRVQGNNVQERQAKKLSLLLDIAQKLSGAFDLDQLLGQVADMTFEVMAVDRVSILLKDGGTGELRPRVARSRLGDASHHAVPRSIANKAVEEKVAILTDNAVADTRFKGQSIVLQSVRSAMCSPLLDSKDDAVGLLYVDNMTATNSFSDEDLQFLVAFSNLASVGLRNVQYAEQIQREAMVRSNFERYFAPNVAAEIATRADAVGVGGEKRPVTVMFSDIRGFTSMSEKMSPDEIASMLSEYFEEMVDIIFEFGGTLDKFIGDAIMALWGAPIAHPDDPDKAVQAAIAMQKALAELNQHWQREGRPTLQIGIGLNHGEVFAGNIGSHRRLEYTVLGDAVNTASRLCSKAAGGEILISPALFDELSAKPQVDQLEPMPMKGKAQPVPVLRVKG